MHHPMQRYVDPRETALELVENGEVTVEAMLQACLNYMSGEDVRDMMESNDFVVEEADEEADDGEDTDIDFGIGENL